jgi:hypothetical protein
MRWQLREQHRGQTLVEFALIIPIFLLVVLGLFDMGRAVLYYSTISNASREAVRLGIVDQNLTAIEQRAIDNASAVIHLDPALIDVEFLAPDLTTTPTCPTAPAIGCVVRVAIRHEFFPATPFIGRLTISGETHQPIERGFASP